MAEDLFARFKGLFQALFFDAFDRTQSTATIVNNANVDTMRGLENVKFILSDESDFYSAFEQREVREVMEGYIGKPNSDQTIVLMSTPKAPGGLTQKIELEKDALYTR